MGLLLPPGAGKAQGQRHSLRGRRGWAGWQSGAKALATFQVCGASLLSLAPGD